MLTDIFSSASVSGVYAGTHRGALHISNTGTKTDIISGYNYCDIDNSGFYYLSIPSLTSVLTDTILTEGIDYEIVNFDKLKFLKDLTLKDSGESFYMISGICLLPSIYNLYFQGFGEPNPKNLLQNDIIVPYISGFHTISDHHQKSKI